MSQISEPGRNIGPFLATMLVRQQLVLGIFLLPPRSATSAASTSSAGRLQRSARLMICRGVGQAGQVAPQAAALRNSRRSLGLTWFQASRSTGILLLGNVAIAVCGNR